VAKSKRAALYLRVSTDEQTTNSQRAELEAAAATRGWGIVATYSDSGVSGSKGRDGRPGLDEMLRDAVKRKFDIVMAWAVDRLGRSLPDLVGTMQELHSARVDLFLQQQSLDTTTPSGRAMFGMLSVFAEFERSMIQSRVKAGLDRAKAEQDAGIVRRGKDGRRKKAIGRPKISPEIEAKIREHLAAGTGMLRTAKLVGVGSGTVQKVARA
jgi:DNA invertase Pin-like site-specific DNA recombinase